MNFMKKDGLTFINSKEDLINYLLKINDTKLMNEVSTILKRLYNSNRKEKEKYKVIMLYIKYRDNKNIETLVCSSLITDTYSFSKQKKIIIECMKNEDYFNEVINECYINYMNKDIHTKKLIDK